MSIKKLIYLIILFYLISEINCSETSNSPINSNFYLGIPYIFDKRCLTIFLEVYNLNFEIFSLSKRFNWILSEQAMLINVDLFSNLRKMYAYLHKASRIYDTMAEFQELGITNPFECSIGPLNNPANILLESNSYMIQAEVDSLECACRCLQTQVQILEGIKVGYCIFILEFILFISERACFLLTILEYILGFLRNILFYHFGIGDASYINTHKLGVLLELPGIIQDELSASEAISTLIDYILTGENFEHYSNMYYDTDLGEFESGISRTLYLQHNMMCEGKQIENPSNSEDSNLFTSQKMDMVQSNVDSNVKVESPANSDEEMIKKKVSSDLNNRRGRSRRTRRTRRTRRDRRDRRDRISSSSSSSSPGSVPGHYPYPDPDPGPCSSTSSSSYSSCSSLDYRSSTYSSSYSPSSHRSSSSISSSSPSLSRRRSCSSSSSSSSNPSRRSSGSSSSSSSNPSLSRRRSSGSSSSSSSSSNPSLSRRRSSGFSSSSSSNPSLSRRRSSGFSSSSSSNPSLSRRRSSGSSSSSSSSLSRRSSNSSSSPSCHRSYSSSSSSGSSSSHRRSHSSSSSHRRSRSSSSSSNSSSNPSFDPICRGYS
ncbi:uncharacterized protein CMU_002260 [Cryptosporidium muris RN66]|uniref:Uncharacterized protein n=1 Tax=Cryptosporidium muris (strain RN66) TaxID=441375 RepID=B6AGL4_CRYMR|nr:uncharacterized protein CMU_002260 [Cryptosporidium muris RN66]EEA07355.1 hypothetical protein CMU_002260 [Cryptosporidium muris RN66]|eukprot:XP_002141704.1 hypothetical protein [Cryptosporidium muris RN66]